jgi:ParB-like chromosome segregation protein Spo0J
MAPDEYSALKADIAAHGLREPIWVYQGQIIDGRNRYRACRELGIDPPTREWDGNGSLVRFVLSLNLHRRHLSSSQRAALAADIEPMLAAEAKERQRQHGKTAPGRNAETLTQKVEQVSDRNKRSAAAQAATLTGTNRQYVSDAKNLKAQDPAAFERVRQGETTLPQAKRAARGDTVARPEETQRPRARQEQPRPRPGFDPFPRPSKPHRDGLRLARQAIDILAQIPDGDRQRLRGFQLVADWLTNRARGLLGPGPETLGRLLKDLRDIAYELDKCGRKSLMELSQVELVLLGAKMRTALAELEGRGEGK